MLPAFAVLFSAWALVADVVDVNLTCVWGSNPRLNLSSPPKAMKRNLHTPKEAAIVDLRRARAYTLALRWLWTDLCSAAFRIWKKTENARLEITKFENIFLKIVLEILTHFPILWICSLIRVVTFSTGLCYDVNIVTPVESQCMEVSENVCICLKD